MQSDGASVELVTIGHTLCETIVFADGRRAKLNHLIGQPPMFTCALDGLLAE